MGSGNGAERKRRGKGIKGVCLTEEEPLPSLRAACVICRRNCQFSTGTKVSPLTLAKDPAAVPGVPNLELAPACNTGYS